MASPLRRRILTQRNEAPAQGRAGAGAALLVPAHGSHPFPRHGPRHRLGGVDLARVRGLTPWELARAANQGSTPSCLLNVHQHTAALLSEDGVQLPLRLTHRNHQVPGIILIKKVSLEKAFHGAPGWLSR